VIPAPNSQPPSTSREAITGVLCQVLRGEVVDWPGASQTEFYEAFQSRAAYHGVDVLVCHLLKSRDEWSELPEQTRNELLERLRAAGVIEMLRSRDLMQLNQSLQQAGICALLLKGGALAYTHYPEPHLRSRVDTDIFIDAGDIKTIREAFLALDYELQGWIYKSHQFHCFRRDPGFGTVRYDVHWRSNNRSKYARIINYEEAKSDAIPIAELEGVLTLKPTFALLQACLHRSGSERHDPNRLIWLYDIHLLLSAMPGYELLEFAQRAVDDNVQAICCDAINSAVSCFATSVPEQMLKTLSTPSGAKSLNRRYADSQLALIADDLRQLPDMTSKLDLMREYLMPPGDYLLDRYEREGRWWIPVLYFRYFFGGLFERISLR